MVATIINSTSCTPIGNGEEICGIPCITVQQKEAPDDNSTIEKAVAKALRSRTNKGVNHAAGGGKKKIWEARVSIVICMGVTSPTTVPNVEERKQATVTMLPSSIPTLRPCVTRTSTLGLAASHAKPNEKFGGQIQMVII